MRRRTLLTLGLVALGGGMLALGGLDDKFLESRGSLFLTIDNDDNDTDEVLHVSTDAGSVPLLTMNEVGTVYAEGAIQSYAGYLISRNPDNASATANLSWFDYDGDQIADTARIRYGGSGVGNHGGFAIQKTGDNTLLRILDNGDVGIGTTAPGFRLTVRDASHQIAVVDSANAKTWTMTTVGDADFGFYEDGSDQRMVLQEGGNAGIGTNNPTARLHVQRENLGGDMAMIIERSGGSDTPRSIDIADDDSLRIGRVIPFPHADKDLTIDAAGKVGIGTATPSSRLDVNGTTTTDVLTITGGSDLSERFDIEGTVEPGTVVSIDPEHPGRLRVSGGAYDRTVAGIVSGAGGVRPGMTMGQDDSIADGAHPVALTGRVFVKCDAAAGAIEPGDLLTTSERPGYAMKVTDHGRAQGAIIGKAMTRLESGDGLVLVLVALQ